MIVAEILKGLENDRYSGLSDKKRDAIAELVNLFRPSLDVGIDRIRDIVAPIAAQHGVSRMYLFGSRARGDSRPDSDYDFMVSFGEKKGLFAYVALVEDLEDAFGTHVDVITDSDRTDDILSAARKDGILIYAKG